ncbi:Fic family protein [Candidatus Dependentiae bacterium]|jgi:Fic family protein|nr:Fic family protein [Candidatus Dependentiae bacterium]
MTNIRGKYLKVGSSNAIYHAYIPALLGKKLPFEMEIELVNLLVEANRYIGKLDEITDILIAPSFFVEMYARKEATLSSQIEGTQATFSDLIKIEAGIRDKEIPDDVKEIENYLKALSYGLERVKTLPLSLRLIREVHEVLLKGVRGEDKNPGEFRRSQNWIGGRTINTATYVPPPVDQMKELLYNFEKYLHQEDVIPHLLKAALIHAQFEMIHPFLDGNGRIGRLLITFYLNQNRIINKPTLYLSKYFKQHRKYYYEGLLNISEKQDFLSWTKFFLEGIVTTSNEAIGLARKIKELRENDLHKIQALGRSAQNGYKLFNKLFEKPIVSVEDVCNIVNLKFPNAQNLINKFIDNETLFLYVKKKRNRLYVYKSYLDILLRD